MSANRNAKQTPVGATAGGFYTVKEAARLLNISQPSRVTAWLQGRVKTSTGPVIERQYLPIEAVQELGFLDLLEVRFIDYFRNQGVSLQSLRKAAQTARREWKLSHPFATSKAKFLTDRKSIFQATANETHDPVLLNLVSRQFAMYVVLEDLLDRGLTFDLTTGLAQEWHPKPLDFPDIAVNPFVAFGQPTVKPAGVPTSAILKIWQAENGNYSAVADWFEIDVDQTKQAIEFELGLPN